MHISASVAELPILAHERKLPEPVAMSARKGKASFTVDFDSLTALNLWAEALEFGEAVNSHTHPDGSAVHTRVSRNWHGWHVRLRYEQDPAPDPVLAEVGAAMADALSVISRPRTGVVVP